MDIASYEGHDKVVQLLLDHGVQVDVPDMVSDYIFIHVDILRINDVYTTEVNELTSVT